MTARASLLAFAFAATACGGAQAHDDVLTVQVGEMPAPEVAGPTGPNVDARGVVTSYGKLAIGATRAAVLALLGPPQATASEADERASYESAGYEPDDELVFIAGFDKADRFGFPKDPSVPVFKVFYRADRVVGFKLSIYVYDDEPASMADLDASSPLAKADRTRVGFAPRCYLFATRTDAIATFGQPELYEPTDSYGNATLHWLRRGVSVVLDEATIVALDVYGQLPSGAEQAFRARVAKSALDDED